MKLTVLLTMMLIMARFVFAALQNSVTSFGITWTFDKQYETGQFVTGDWWVVGPVTVQSVSPAPSGGRNGSVLAPTGDIVGFGGRQGYDSRANNYNSSLSVGFPATVPVNRTLISTISHTSTPNLSLLRDHFENSDSYLKGASLLTCLSSVPPADAFRPPYLGAERPLFRKSSIRWDRLLTLADPGNLGAANLAKFTRYYERPWLDYTKAWTARYYHPTDNMPDYGREIGRINGEATLILNVNIPQQDKGPLLIGYIQLGIDYYYITKAGVDWRGEGGHSSGRKWPIIFAGLVLDDDNLKNVDQLGRTFGEDSQTYDYNDPSLPAAIRGQKGWTGATAMYDNIYWAGPVPKYEHLDPSQWYTLGNDGSGENAGCHSEAYRRCCTSLAWVGQGLSAVLMGAKTYWGHDAFFDYVDRWMTEKDTQAMKDKLQAACGGVGTASGTVWDQYVKFMWAYYRNAPIGADLTQAAPKAEPGLAVFPYPYNPAQDRYLTVQVPFKGKVQVRITAGNGREVFRYRLPVAGQNRFLWDGKNLEGSVVEDGIYYLTLEAGPRRAVQKVLLVKQKNR